jgi:hypothetical protein
MNLLAPLTLRRCYDLGVQMDYEFEDMGTRMLRKMPIAITTPRLK